jgi:hypothetical protein
MTMAMAMASAVGSLGGLTAAAELA